MNQLVHELQTVTGRFGSEEAEAWRSSLPAVAELLSATAFDPLHLFFRSQADISLEYQLPAASAWCDMVILGCNADRPSALIVELKHWALGGDQPGPREGLIMRSGTSRLHPSRQVERYTEYVRRFHSAVQEHDASVNGCVFFTRSGNASAYKLAPNNLLAANFPVFTTAVADVEEAFPRYVSRLLTAPSKKFAQSFENGTYKQDRGFVAQIGQQILDPASRPFVLLDNQEEALLLCRERLSKVIDGRDGLHRKHVVLVLGPPGSGKSAVAARLWASLVTDGTLKEGNVVVTTTSASQSSNWIYLVDKAAGLGGASGVVKKATAYHPISTVTLGRLRKKHGEHLFKDASDWRGNLSQLRQLSRFQPGAEDDAYLASLVDEAHALINPEHLDGRGQFGFAPPLGPQAFHVIRASRLTVFFMDPEQGYRDRENTTLADIRRWAAELDATVDEIDLSGAQFRCAGSKEFVEWIDTVRSNSHPHFAGRQALRWQRKQVSGSPGSVALKAAEPLATYGRPGISKGMDLVVADEPPVLENWLREKMASGYSARILSSYNRAWKTSEAPTPHGLPPELQDFSIQTRSGALWAKPWNFVPANSGDYTLFVQAQPWSEMGKDQLCEVGCPYAVRGFDFDFVGLIWGADLVWRTDRWIVQPQHVFETGIASSVRRAKKEANPIGPAHESLLGAVWQAYRVLLTRAMRGLVLWVEDDETRQYLLKASGGGSVIR